MKREVITVTTNASGAGTGYSGVVSGWVSAIRYVKTDFDDGSTMTVTAEATGETIWTEAAVNASATRAPRQATHSTAGAAALYAAGGTAVNDRILVVQDRIRVVVASGGNVKTGTYHVMVD